MADSKRSETIKSKKSGTAKMRSVINNKPRVVRLPLLGEVACETEGLSPMLNLLPYSVETLNNGDGEFEYSMFRLFASHEDNVPCIMDQITSQIASTTNILHSQMILLYHGKEIIILTFNAVQASKKKMGWIKNLHELRSALRELINHNLVQGIKHPKYTGNSPSMLGKGRNLEQCSGDSSSSDSESDGDVRDHDYSTKSSVRYASDVCYETERQAQRCGVEHTSNLLTDVRNKIALNDTAFLTGLTKKIRAKIDKIKNQECFKPEPRDELNKKPILEWELDSDEIYRLKSPRHSTSGKIKLDREPVEQRWTSLDSFVEALLNIVDANQFTYTIVINEYTSQCTFYNTLVELNKRLKMVMSSVHTDFECIHNTFIPSNKIFPELWESIQEQLPFAELDIRETKVFIDVKARQIAVVMGILGSEDLQFPMGYK